MLNPLEVPIHLLPYAAPNAILLDEEESMKKGVISPYLVPDLSSAQLVDWYTDMMDIRAGQLGMEDSIYCDNPAGGVNSTPQDQVTLWRHAMTLDGFWDFTGVGSFDRRSRCAAPLRCLRPSQLPSVLRNGWYDSWLCYEHHAYSLSSTLPRGPGDTPARPAG